MQGVLPKKISRDKLKEKDFTVRCLLNRGLYLFALFCAFLIYCVAEVEPPGRSRVIPKRGVE